MRGSKLSKIMLSGVVAVALLVLAQSEASAFSWGSHSSGSWGSHSSGSWGSHSSGSWGWGGWKARRHWRGHSSGSWGSHSSGSWGSHSSGSYGSHSSGGWVPAGSAAPQYESAPADGEPPQPPADNTSTRFNLTVPADAIVYVNGKKTTSTGTTRTYTSHGLTAGRSYSFQIRAEVQREGKPVVREQTLVLTAGQSDALAFNFTDDAPAESVADKKVQTKLTLHVPAEAKVLLAGHETSTPGETREYISSHLAAGQSWDNYQIEVRLGEKTVSRTITLRGGENQELTFDLDEPLVASTKR